MRQQCNDVILCLGFCKQILPDEETVIDKKDIEELLAILASLEEVLSESKLPSYTQDLIRKHVANIKNALQGYGIVGAKSLQEAMKSAVGEVVANKPAFDEAKGSAEITTFSRLICKLKGISDATVKTEKTISAGTKLLEQGGDAISAVCDFLDKM